MIEPFRPLWSAYADLDRRIWVTAAVRAVNTMGLSLVMAFMAIYLVDTRGTTALLYGAIYLVANLFQSAAQGYAGNLSDRVGRCRLMTWALAVRTAVLVGLGFQVLAHASIPVLALTLVVSGILRGFFEPVAYALVADVATPGQRVVAYGLQRMGTNLGWAIGPALGGFLAAVIPYGTVFFSAAAVLLFAAIATSRIQDPGPTPRSAPSGAAARGAADRAPPGLVRRPDVILLLACTFLLALVHVQLFSTLSIFLSAELHLTKANIGLVYMVNGVAVLLFQVPAVGIIGKMGLHRSLILGSGLYAVALAGLGVASGFAGAATAVLIMTVGEVIVAPAHQAVAADLGDPERLGRTFGLVGTMQMLGVAFAPMVGGALYDELAGRPLVLWGILAGFAVLLAGAYGLLAAVTRDADRARAGCAPGAPRLSRRRQTRACRPEVPPPTS